MKLSQALKQKNRLAGEITQQQQILIRENARRSDSVSTVDRQKVYDHILDLSNRLGELKGKIAAANVGIYTKLERMAEMKSHIAFLQSLPKKEGEEVAVYGRSDEKIVYTWNSLITQQVADGMVADLQQQIGNLQDQVDEYNATTEI
jgi:hypothetical protein